MRLLVDKEGCKTTVTIQLAGNFETTQNIQIIKYSESQLNEPLPARIVCHGTGLMDSEDSQELCRGLILASHLAESLDKQGLPGKPTKTSVTAVLERIFTNFDKPELVH